MIKNTDWRSYCLIELAYTPRVNEKCHVYSFEVLALEVHMGKHSDDLILSPSTSSSSSPPVHHILLFASTIVKLAFACLQRPSMKHLSQKLSPIFYLVNKKLSPMVTILVTIHSLSNPKPKSPHWRIIQNNFLKPFLHHNSLWTICHEAFDQNWKQSQGPHPKVHKNRANTWPSNNILKSNIKTEAKDQKHT